MANILILTYWSYPDALIQSYTLPYVDIIRKKIPGSSSIFLVTLEKEPLDKAQRNKMGETLKARGVTWLPFHYRRFGAGAVLLMAILTWKLNSIIRTHGVAVIHCWCTPAGAIGYVLSRLTGAKLVIDSYEPHAEAMVENGTWRRNGIAFQLLFWLEKKQTERASRIIAAASGMKSYALKKYAVDIREFSVKPACVDLALFSERNLKRAGLLDQLGLKDKLTCVYAGKFGGIYLDKEVFHFFKAATVHWGKSFRVLLLTSHSRQEIVSFCLSAGIDPGIVVQRFVDHRDMPDYLGLADFAITPVKPVPTKRYCTPIKNGEYWAMGLPVVIPGNISDDSAIIEENEAGFVLRALDQAEYLRALQKMDILLNQPRNSLFMKIRNLAVLHRNFSIAEQIYSDIYGAHRGAIHQTGLNYD